MVWTAVTLLTAACVYDDGAEVSAGFQNELTVGFKIAVENTTPQSRGTIADGNATWGDDYPTIVGPEFDSRIDFSTFRMALYRVGADGSLELFASFGNRDLYYFSSTTPDALRTVYRLTAIFRTDKPLEELRRGKYRAMVWLNTPEKPSGLENPSALDGLSFGNMGVADRENVLKYCVESGALTDPVEDVAQEKFDLIPMWGCATVSLAGIEPGKAYELTPENAAGDNSILLLRSMAKTSVEPGEELTAKYGPDFKINSVTLVHANRRGYVMPAGWQRAADTRTIALGATAREAADTKKWNVTTEESAPGTPVLYLPEYINDNNRIHLTVDYTFKGKRARNDIYFCMYENGKPLAPYNIETAEEQEKYKNTIYDIVRNHHYRFILGIEEATAEIVVRSLRIEDWVYGGGGFLDPVE